MSDEYDVLCCHEECTLTAVVVQWVEQLPATQVTRDQIPKGVHIGSCFVLYISPLYIISRPRTHWPMLTDCVVHTPTANNSLLPFNKMFFKEVL